jgi:hypothetical protein
VGKPPERIRVAVGAGVFNAVRAAVDAYLELRRRHARIPDGLRRPHGAIRMAGACADGGPAAVVMFLLGPAGPPGGWAVWWQAAGKSGELMVVGGPSESEIWLEPVREAGSRAPLAGRPIPDAPGRPPNLARAVRDGSFSHIEWAVTAFLLGRLGP